MFYEIHLWGLHAIEILQSRLNIFERFFLFVSSVGDPSQLYVVYFPIIFSFFPNTGFKILLASSIGEWINFLMKWIFHGDRPYWWVEENHLKSLITIEQFYNTCETGPGTPSGHVMLTSMIYYILINDIIKIWKPKIKINFMLWFFYISLIVLMGLSRLYIATHFPHQCILGFLSGLPLAKLIDEFNFNKFMFHHYVFATLLLLGSAYSLEGILTLLGIDVAWTINMARKWCLKRSWIHITTSPYYVTWRFAGALFGLGLLKYFSNHRRVIQTDFNKTHKTLLAISGVVVSNILLSLISKVSNNQLIMYAFIFIIYSIIPSIVSIVLPKLIRTLCMKPVVN